VILGIDASNLISGGGLRHLQEFLNHAEPNDFGFTKVIVWAGPKTVASITKKSDWLHLVSVPQFEKSILSRLLWRKRFLKPFVESECDVLFSPGGIALFSSTPEVTMSRNMQPFDRAERKKVGLNRARLRLELLRFVQAKSFRHVSKLIFLNQFAKETLSNLLNLDKGVIIPHGCGHEFELSPRTQVRFNELDKIILTYVSTVNSYKHQREVVEATRVISNKYKNLELRLIGGGAEPYLSQIKSMVQNDSRIDYLGKIYGDELVKKYHESDLFIYASACENLPNTLLEAMKSGLPIACSNIEPMPSVLGDGGVYFDPSNVKSIVSAIDQLLSDHALRERLSLKAFERSKQYSWMTCANSTLAVLKEAALSK